MMKEEIQNKEFKYLVRIANTDLDGNKSVNQALRKIKGINFMYANAICEIAGIDKLQKIGNMKEHDIKKIDEAIKNSAKIPTWLYNRKRDKTTGEDKHLISVDLSFTKDSDIQSMKKMRNYKGIIYVLCAQELDQGIIMNPIVKSFSP